MGKHAVSSTSKGKSSGSKPPASSLKSAVLSSEARKKKRMARSRPRTPPRSRPNKKVPTERSHRSKPANRSSIRRRSKPAARRPPTPPSPPSVSPTVEEEEQEPLRLAPKRAPPHGSIESVLRRPAAASGEEPPWLRWKRWPESYVDAGGTWELLSLHWDHGLVTERWEWKELPVPAAPPAAL